MPRFEKGSPQALEWAKKMKQAREAKKQMKGGMITDDPFGLSSPDKPLTLRKRKKTPSPIKTPVVSDLLEPPKKNPTFRPIVPAPISGKSYSEVIKPIGNVDE